MRKRILFLSVSNFGVQWNIGHAFFVFCFFFASVEDLSVTKETEMTETVEIASFGNYIDI